MAEKVPRWRRARKKACKVECYIMRSERAKHGIEKRREKNLRRRKREQMREGSEAQGGKKAARKPLMWWIATFHGEFIRWDWISPWFQVGFTSFDFLLPLVIIVVPLPFISRYISVHWNASSLQQSTPSDRKIFSAKTCGDCERRERWDRVESGSWDRDAAYLNVNFFFFFFQTDDPFCDGILVLKSFRVLNSNRAFNWNLACC